jgi:hypothetical protein
MAEQLDLAPIEARLAAVESVSEVGLPGGEWIASHPRHAVLVADEDDTVVAVLFGGWSGAEQAALTEFIARARQDVPALLAEVRRLREAAVEQLGMVGGAFAEAARQVRAAETWGQVRALQARLDAAAAELADLPDVALTATRAELCDSCGRPIWMVDAAAGTWVTADGERQYTDPVNQGWHLHGPDVDRAAEVGDQAALAAAPDARIVAGLIDPDGDL